jgi:hypothetical protein
VVDILITPHLYLWQASQRLFEYIPISVANQAKTEQIRVIRGRGKSIKSAGS